MFVENKGYLYNTESLGQIDSVIITFASGVSNKAKYGVYLGETALNTYQQDYHQLVNLETLTDTTTNITEGVGFFQISTSAYNCRIASVKIVYTQGNTPPPIDNIPPVFTTDYPKTENITKNSFDLKVKTDEPCTVFYKVVADGGTTPTKDELLASDKTISVETKNTEYTATVTELAPETTYNIHLIAKDAAGNVQDDFTTITATTLSAFVKTIALSDIEEKYYWGETATIEWTTNIDAATDLDSIIIYKGNQKILKYPIDITSGEAEILIGNGAAPDGNTYGTDYRLKIISGSVESELSENFTIVPTITINRLLTDINTGQSDFINDNVRMKGLVTGVKSKALTIQDGMRDFCATYITNNTNTSVEIYDSVYWEVAVSQSGGSIKATTKQVTIINQKNKPQTPRITELSEIDANNGLKYLVVTIEGVTCQNRVFYKDNDAISYANTLFSGSNNYFKDNRKYNISGVLNIGTENKEIWPRSQVPEDFYLYSNDTTLAELLIGGENALGVDTLFFKDLTTAKKIHISTNSKTASASVTINGNAIDTADSQMLSPLDSIFVTVNAEDESEKRYKVVIDQYTIKSNFCTIRQILHTNSKTNPYANKLVTFNGTVAFANSSAKNTEFYIQDSAGMWSGIIVYDEGNRYVANMKIGDKIQVTGRLIENSNISRIEEIEDITVLNSNNEILSDTIIVEDARSSAYLNAIVTIDSVVCTNGVDNLFKVCDLTNSIYVYNKYRINDFKLAIDSMYRITGIVYYTSADNSYRIIPRTADDIVKIARLAETKPIEPKPDVPKPDNPQPPKPDTTTVDIVGLAAIGLTAYTVERTIIIENADAAVAVFDIAGRLIATARPAQRIVIKAPHTGIYIVRTRQNAIKVAVE